MLIQGKNIAKTAKKKEEKGKKTRKKVDKRIIVNIEI